MIKSIRNIFLVATFLYGMGMLITLGVWAYNADIPQPTPFHKIP